MPSFSLILMERSSGVYSAVLSLALVEKMYLFLTRETLLSVVLSFSRLLWVKKLWAFSTSCWLIAANRSFTIKLYVVLWQHYAVPTLVCQLES